MLMYETCVYPLGSILPALSCSQNFYPDLSESRSGAQIQFFFGGGVRSRDRVFIRGRDRLL